MAKAIQQEENKGRDRISMILFMLYLLFLLISVFLIGRIAYIQLFYKPDERLVKYFTPQSKEHITDPVRGSILARDGRLLASSTPMYQVYMDCTVQKEYFNGDKKKENEWIEKARELSVKLAQTYKDKTASEYAELILSGRRNGRKFVKIGHQIDHGTLQKVKSFPLFNEGAYKGGIIVNTIDTRQYPYGALARRTIGYVKDNSNSNGNNLIGLEGKYNYILHGKEGIEWMKKTDNRGWIRNYDSTLVHTQDGLDLKTTLDIDIQDIADRALRRQLKDQKNIEGACAIVMDVKTGGIRAMVNLSRDEDNNLREIYNYAIGRAGDPGSVFKLSTLMTLLEDGKVTLETTVPTFKGKWSYNGVKLPDDTYLAKWDSDRITVSDGLMISSNHVFRYLACDNYGDNPRRFMDKLYEYKLTEKFDFDVAGLATPDVPAYGSSQWSGTTLPSIAIGYSVMETPLHIVTFYNGIANKGKLMKPYLVEAIEKNGRTEKKMGPVVLNGSICSRATADTLTRALRKVVTGKKGTGSKLKNAKCAVAGKTGTAQITFNVESNGKLRTVYKDKDGRKQHQGTFVGFFPAEDPKYTAIVVVYSKLSREDFYGGSIPASAFREIVDNIYTLSPAWGEEIRKSGQVPEMKARDIETGKDKLDEVPDVKGLGLKDAIYSIENCGYRCYYSGTGHVNRQDPPAGAKVKRGETVTLILK